METQTNSTPAPIIMHSGPSFGPPPEPTSADPSPTPVTPEPQPNPGPIIVINTDAPPPSTLPSTDPIPTAADIICIPCTNINRKPSGVHEDLRF